MHEAAVPDASLLADALNTLPEGVVIFGRDWTIDYVNRVGAALMGRSPAELIGRNPWVAVPQLGGTIFDSFLLHAAAVDHRVTWQGFHAAIHRWLHASALRVGERLHVHFHEVADRGRDGAPVASPVEPPRTPGSHEPGHGDGNEDRLRYLAEVSEALISTLDAGESATTLAELVVGRLYDWAVVAVHGDDGAATERAWAHVDPARLSDLEAYLTGRAPGSADTPEMVTALLSGQPVQITTFDPDLIAASLTTAEVREAWRRLDAASCTIVPLRARGETFGTLSLLNSSRRAPHTEMQIATAVEVARRGGLALDNARLFGRQQRVAETLQQSLLSPPPQPAGLEIAVRYVPAASHMHVGGDWYDGMQQPDDATLLVIGDVVGHNVEAAAAMGQIRSIVRTIAYDRQESPAQVLCRVDEVLTGLRIGKLATVLVARIEQTPDHAPIGQRTVRWSSAGHLPPLLLHPDGSVQVLQSPPERLLGTASEQQRSDHEAILAPGDTLILYTDGLIEHGRIGIDDGIARLTSVLAEIGNASVDKMCDQVLARIVPERTDDDIALIAIRCRPEGP